MITVTKTDLPPLKKYISYLEKIWQNRWVTNNGEFLVLLEKKLKEYLRVKNVICVSNGTLALFIALKVLKIKGEVITTPFTFAATTNVIILAGLKPVFADIDPETFNIDPDDVKKKITPNTSAILATHVYGNPCYVEALQEIADRYNLKLIYDAAHAFGVEYKGESILNYGDISTLSFHATKVFNTIEGGAIVVNDERFLEEVKLMRNHGIISEEEVVLPGINAKMNEFQAAIGLCNLEFINGKIQFRKRIYEYYKNKLGCLNVRFQRIIASRYNYSYMPVLFQDRRQRDRIYQELKKHNIKARKYFYPLTVDFKYFKEEDLTKKYKLRNAVDIANRILCLPIYPDLKLSEVDQVIAIIRDILLSEHKEKKVYAAA